MKVLKTWHSDRGGQVSPIVKAINDDRGEWQRKLWELFYEMSTTKLPDWAHEDEYRIVVPDLLEFHRLGHRTLEFPLSSLEGIVFGLRTNIADKLTIMKLIHAKCVNEGRSEFAFHQMVYRYTDGTLVRI